MKKKLFLLIGILFLFPVIVQASEQEFHRRTNNYGDLQCENANRTVGLDAHYENGIYYLDDIQESFPLEVHGIVQLRKFICVRL